MALLLDLIEIARGGRRLIDALLIAVTVQANLAAVGNEAFLEAPEGEARAPLADELRRPITMNAMAASLGLPFETVRRRVRQLTNEGLFRVVKGGVIVPAAVLDQPHCREMAERAYARLQAFYYEVTELGLLPELPTPSVQLAPGAHARPAVIHLVAEYVLREVGGLLESMGGLIDGLIAFAIFRANTAHFSHTLRGGEGYGAEDMVEDSRRRPVPSAEVVARLGMPPETVRRHIARLLERGVCRRAAGGLIVPAEFWAQPKVREAVFGNAANLNRLLARLARVGVLDQWERRARGDAQDFARRRPGHERSAPR